MNDLLIYLLKSTTISGIFYLYYVVALRYKQFHTFNRSYILLGLVAAAILPMLHFDIAAYNAPASVPLLDMLPIIKMPGEEAEIATARSFSGSTGMVLPALYALVVVVLLCRTGFASIKLALWRRRYTAEKAGNIAIVLTDLPHAPFSFFNNIYWNSQIDRNSEHGQLMMRHEMVHIRQGHSWDRLLAQLMTAVLWANRFNWLFEKELCLVHEFIADEHSVGSGNSGLLAELLLSAHMATNQPLTHSFFASPIKKRIAMLKTQVTSLRTWRMAAVLPLAVVVATFFTTSFAKSPTRRAAEQITVLVDAGHGGPDAGGNSRSGLREKDLTLKITRALQQEAPKHNIQVLLTRSDDSYPTLEQRRAAAKGAGAELFISIHINKSTSGVAAPEYQVTVCSKQPQYEQSKMLASAVIQQLKLENAVLFDRNLHVLKGNTVPAILIECGDIDDAANIARLSDDAQLRELCNKIFDGVVAYKRSATKR